MYGLVNQAFQRMLVDRYGQTVWGRVADKAGIEEEQFTAFAGYPDQVTHSLLGAASLVLGVGPEVILEAFGQFWVHYANNEGYSDLLRLAGNDLPTFLKNLDLLHARLARSYPQLKPPSFRCVELRAGTLELHYFSERVGLTPFVVGLLQGVGELLNTKVRVRVAGRKADGHPNDVFLIDYERRD